MTLGDYPRWIVMWLMAGTIFLGCKGLTWRAAPRSSRLSSWLVWPGLDATAFFAPTTAANRPRWWESFFAAAKTGLGAALFWLGGWMAGGHDLLRGWLGMIGVVFLLHFGVFHMLSCLWRALGQSALPIMNHPWAATSVSDFWGRRWNRAFRDLTHRFLFRPLTKALKPRLALLVGFAISGLIHEAVITLPAGGGYGGPTLYFCLQGLGIMIEHSQPANSLGLGQGWRGRLFAFALLLGPVFFLFPPIFVRNIVLPMMDALGAA